MPIVVTSPVNIPLPAEGNCVPCCGAAVLTVTCRSWTATPSLCGFSGYDDGSYDSGNPTAWAGYGRKWQTRTLDGGSMEVQYADSGCTGTCVGVLRYEYSGVVTVDCTGSYTAYANRADYAGSPCPSGTFQKNNSVTGIQIFFGCQDPFTDHSTLTVKTTTPCSPPCYNTTNSHDRYDATETLSDEDTIEDAIDRESPAEDAPPSCCAITGIIATTSPESTLPISLGESTRVTLTLALTGAPSTAYLVTLTFSNAIDSDSTPLADTTEEVEITTDGAGEAEVEYDIPQPDSDRRRCYVSATVEPA